MAFLPIIASESIDKHMNWMEIKDLIVALTGVSKDGLHVLAGFGIMMGTAFLFQRSLSDPLPLALVGIATFANELYDWKRADPWETLAEANRVGAIQDVWLTLLIPTILFVAVRSTCTRFFFCARCVPHDTQEAVLE